MDVIRFLLSGICHQYHAHSLWVQGQPLPLCLRCMGMYLGALGSLIVLLIIGKVRRLPSLAEMIFLGFLLAVWLLDGLNSAWQELSSRLLLYPPLNLLRLATGIGAGIVISRMLYPLLFDMRSGYSVAPAKTERLRRLGVVILFISGFIAVLALYPRTTVLAWNLGLGLAVLVVLGVVNVILIDLVPGRWFSGYSRKRLALASLAVPLLSLVELSGLAFIKLAAGLGGLAY